MGRLVVRAVAEAPDLALAAATVRPGTLLVGGDAGEVAGVGPLGVTVTDRLADAHGSVDCVVDFTLPQAVPAHLEFCARAGVPLVLGVTGLDPALQADVEALARRVPVVQAANFSVGVTLALDLLRTAAHAFGADADVEIVDTHHRGKRDAPSGTALAMGRAVADGRGTTLDALRLPDQAPERVPGALGFSALRAGDVVGEHAVTFFAAGERLELAHRATDRGVFARGALRAARWLLRGPAPGLYDMRDVLGLDPG